VIRQHNCRNQQHDTAQNPPGDRLGEQLGTQQERGNRVDADCNGRLGRGDQLKGASPHEVHQGGAGDRQDQHHDPAFQLKGQRTGQGCRQRQCEKQQKSAANQHGQGQRQILGQRIAQFNEEIVGLEAQIRSADEQLGLIEGELADLQSLFDKGLTPKSRLLALQRRRAEIQGERGQNLAAIARAKQNIAEAEIRIFELRTEQVSEVVAELREVETELLDLQERLGAAEDVQRHTAVISPADGVVVDMQVHTEGAVIRPGDRLLDVVPGNEKLIIDARVNPTDIDIVHPGLTAQVRLVAFNQRITPTVEGIVSRVSADRLTDESTGESYYTAKVELIDQQDPRLEGLTLLPGMPAEVLIRTGERTLLQYLVSPVRQSFTRSLREQ